MSQDKQQPRKVLTLNRLVETPSANEIIKDASNYLRGSILDDIEVEVSAGISEDNAQLTKFHGTYLQDDRDQRLLRQQKKLEPAWGFMIRVRIPGGVLTADQWCQMDDIADRWAGERLKLTTRQAIQFHGIIKFDLAKSMRALHAASVDSIAACGDVNRNVMCSPIPVGSAAIHQQCLASATAISEHLLPRTNAWYEIWIDGKKIVSEQEEDEPIYGKHYLPRKFKIAMAIPPHNDTDVFANDIGLIAIVENGTLAGFNVCAGGGLGTTHSDPTTYPRLADVLGFCAPAEVVAMCEHIVTIQRDYGNRSERKNARLKYTLDRVGVDWFREELQRRSGIQLGAAKKWHFEHNGDRYGWSRDDEGLWYLLLYVEHGRVFDAREGALKSALRQIAEKRLCDFRLSGNQNIALGRVKERDKDAVSALLEGAGCSTDATHLSAMRRHAVACVALPTCGLAMAEAQRYLPDLISKIEPMLERYGLEQDAINVRMTGCPNGCGRPWLGEIAFIGKSVGRYNMYIGADFAGERMSTLYKENLGESAILAEVDRLLADYASNRSPDEHFGDFVLRSGHATTQKPAS